MEPVCGAARRGGPHLVQAGHFAVLRSTVFAAARATVKAEILFYPRSRLEHLLE